MGNWPIPKFPVRNGVFWAWVMFSDEVSFFMNVVLSTSYIALGVCWGAVRSRVFFFFEIPNF